MINLDNNATTKPSAAAVSAAMLALTDHWHNPSSVHRGGQDARRLVELARQDLADLIGAKPRDLIFTSGGTESINLAVRGLLAARPASTPPVIVTSRVEHAAVRDLAQELEQTRTCEVRWAPVDRRGVIDLSAFDQLISGAALAIVQWANNETGVIQPIREIAATCERARARFICDGTQWIGKMPATVNPAALRAADTAECPCDALVFSPHKFHGPKGVGLLWLRPGVRLRPQLIGTQEMDRRGGTENVPGILAAGAAAREAAAWLARPDERLRLAALRDRFEQRVTAAIPTAVVNGAGSPHERLWNTTNIGFPPLEAEALVLFLSERGVAVSAGAACSSGSLEPSPVLLAMGVPEPVAHGSLRFSLSRDTTAEELDQAVDIVTAAVAAMAG